MRLASIFRSRGRRTEAPNFEGTMTMRDSKGLRGGRMVTAAFLGLALVHAGCGLDEVKVPELEGPSELGTSLKVTATPDVITADGFSTSLIQVQVFDQNGSPTAGRQVILALADSGGNFADIGTLRSTTSCAGTGDGGDHRFGRQRRSHRHLHRPSPHGRDRRYLGERPGPPGRNRRQWPGVPVGEDRVEVCGAAAIPTGP